MNFFGLVTLKKNIILFILLNMVCLVTCLNNWKSKQLETEYDLIKNLFRNYKKGNVHKLNFF